jgi:hypothetical protein
MSRRHRVRVRWQNAQALARAYIPNPHAFVERATNQEIRLRVEICAKHVAGVAFEGIQSCPLREEERGSQQSKSKGG